MATDLYLAMSSEEFRKVNPFPAGVAWLDSCFSPSGPGLDQLPPSLPPASLLILTDRIPYRNHDPVLISEQLYQTVTALDCAGLLLDFEKPRTEDLTLLTRHLTSALPCPVAVSDLYARDTGCPVFLSPCPHHVPLAEHIAPWKDREIWLDLASDAEVITVTASGAAISPFPRSDIPFCKHAEPRLHCHYCMEIRENHIRFILHRTQDNLEELLQEASQLGIQTCVGLYQEISK